MHKSKYLNFYNEEGQQKKRGGVGKGATGISTTGFSAFQWPFPVKLSLVFYNFK